MTAADVGTDSVRGRYTAGVVEGEAVNGFTHDSDVETFVALSAWIDNWRWAGVPFRLVTGKRMPSRTTEVVVSFKPVSHRSEEHTSELQSLMRISYAVLCLKKKQNIHLSPHYTHLTPLLTTYSHTKITI